MVDKCRTPGNTSLNNIKCFYDPIQSSAWLKYRNYAPPVKLNPKSDDETVIDDESIITYGQGNYFLRLIDIFEDDPYLHGASFANITTWKHSLNTSKVASVNATTYKSYLSKHQFISLTFVESTNVATCGVTADKKPVLIDASQFTTEEQKEAEQFCCQDTSKIEKLFLIDLHPERKNVKISDSYANEKEK